MKHISTAGRKDFFAPLMASDSVQAATMVLQPGESSDEAVRNEHPRSKQWLLVISGAGRATVSNRQLDLTAGSLLLIEKDEPHRITNNGTTPLVTINFYSPPAYPAGDTA